MDVTSEILDVVNHYLRKVRRSGPENIMAVCPFHRKTDGSEESTPSFSMSLTKGVYFCHSCHEKGGLQKFLREIGLDQGTIAIRYGFLIESAARNIGEAPDPTRADYVWHTEGVIDDTLLGVFNYDASPMLPGFNAETLQNFEVGWDGWNHRITFPIRNLSGQLVAVSGRAVSEGQWPRYKIYDEEYRQWGLPPRHGWNKRSVLWNADKVFPETFFKNPDQTYIVVVEGFKAAMHVWQSGITNVVALLGSYLSWEHEWILERIGAPVYLFLDNNGAGWRGQIDAAKRLTKKLPVRFIEYPERLYEDEDAQPDSLTEDEVLEQKASSPTYETWLLKQRQENHGIR